jgi:hypothetical protein
VAASLVGGLGILEGGIRLKMLLFPSQVPEAIVLDDRLGWKAAPGLTFRGERRDASGRPYAVSIHEDEFGCREAPRPPGPTPMRALFIGDSFTQAFDVSDDKAYWARVGSLRGLDVVACGAVGYGTLQELLVLGDALKQFDPAVVVLQFSSNDFINNSYALESRSSSNNNGMERPYLLADGRIVRRLPRTLAPLRDLANRYFRSLYFLMSRMDRLTSRTERSVELDIERDGTGSPFFADAAQVTSALLGRIRARVGPQRKLFAFCVDEVSPFGAEFRRLATANGFTIVPGIAEGVTAAEAAGAVAHAGDGMHWNNEGHEIAGELLSHRIPD